MYTAVYIFNICLTKVVSKKTPVEVWSEQKTLAKHLTVFNFVCYARVLDEKQSKLDDKTERRIFLDYNTESKVYHIYNLRMKKLMINGDVEFDRHAA